MYIEKGAKPMFLKLLLYCLENEGHILLLVLAIENACFGIFSLSIIVKNLKKWENRVMNFKRYLIDKYR